MLSQNCIFRCETRLATGIVGVSCFVGHHSLSLKLSTVDRDADWRVEGMNACRLQVKSLRPPSLRLKLWTRRI